ncbi:MAG TPA: amino acid adenylation domain-containing protein [Actinocrinis sp.]
MTQEIIDEQAYVLPASFGQERLWMLDLLGAGPAYNLNGAIRLTGPLDPARLRFALDAVAARHEAVRTTFEFGVDGGLVQVIRPGVTVPVAEHDVRDQPAQRRQAAAVELVQESVTAVFDLTAGPLLRAVVVRLDHEEWVLGLTAHHSIADGWSIGIVLDEVARHYRAAAHSSQQAALPELAVQFGDWAAWQRDQTPAAEDLSYWAQQLRGARPALPPTWKEAGARTTWDGAGLPVAVPDPVRRGLTALAEQQRVTAFMALLATFSVALADWCDQEDLVVGTPVAGRDRVELEGLIGFFVNTLPLCVAVRRGTTFRQLLDQVRQMCLAAYAHQNVPFETIAEQADAGAGGGDPLVRVMFGLQASSLPSWDVPGLTASPFPVPELYSPVELAVTMFEHPDGSVEGRVLYAAGPYATDDVTDLLATWQRALAWAVGHPDAPLGEFDPMSPAERAAAPAELDATAAAPSRTGSVAQWIEQAVDAAPDAVAVVAADESLTYAELEARANRLAWFLRERGVGPETIVGVCVTRSTSLAVALLAVLKAGGAYLPLEPDYPASRLAFMLDDARPLVTLVDGATIDVIAGTSAIPRDRTSEHSIVRLDRPDAEGIAGFPDSRPPAVTSPENLVYVIYTSGSTGKPKGAMNTVAALANRIAWMQDTYKLSPGEGVLHKTPISFDVSGWEWMWPLTAQARLVLARPDGHRDPAYLAALIREHAVTTCHFVPSMLHHFLDEPSVAQCSPPLRRVICSGEELPASLAARFAAALPGAQLHNLYGPTEAAIDVTAHHVQSGDEARARVPIGGPIAGVLLRVLDGNGRLVRPGLPGELCLGGVQLARGYLGRPGLTAERFTPDPFGSGARLYRTGDRVRVLPGGEGEVEFLGRIDDQVKVRGQRIELGEVESALTAHPQVDQAAASVLGDSPADRRLVAYIVCTGDALQVDELRAFLQSRLPQAAVPEQFVTLPRLPLSPNGKLDRAALQATAGAALRSERPRVAPATAAEHALVRIWAETLRIKTAEIGVTDDFYEVGGNSLRAVSAFRAAEQQGLQLPLPVMLGHHTIRDLVEQAQTAHGDA